MFGRLWRALTARRRTFSLVIHYRVKGWGDVEDLEKRHRVQKLVNEALCRSNNGHVDGGDIGSGSINVYLEGVRKPDRATDEIVRLLSDEGILEGAVIAVDLAGHRSPDAEMKYGVVWPPDYAGTFSPLAAPPELLEQLLTHQPFVPPEGPCPYCGKPLRTRLAKQCRFCKRDWHDPTHLRWLDGMPVDE